MTYLNLYTIKQQMVEERFEIVFCLRYEFKVCCKTFFYVCSSGRQSRSVEDLFQILWQTIVTASETIIAVIKTDIGIAGLFSPAGAVEYHHDVSEDAPGKLLVADLDIHPTKLKVIWVKP